MIPATMAHDPLERHSLADLESAERRLRAHISKRRPKPSLTRRIIGVCFSIPMIALGLVFGIRAIETGYIGAPMLGSILLFVGGIMWIYCDWFE